MCVYISSKLADPTRRLPFSWLLYRGVGEGTTPLLGLFH